MHKNKLDFTLNFLISIQAYACVGTSPVRFSSICDKTPVANVIKQSPE